MVVDERYKFVRYADSETTQLFDLQNDPWETRNLAFDSDCQAVCTRLGAAIDDLESRLDNVELPPGLGKGGEA
jgi:arylsulfatase A-like enzyme